MHLGVSGSKMFGQVTGLEFELDNAVGRRSVEGDNLNVLAANQPIRDVSPDRPARSRDDNSHQECADCWELSQPSRCCIPLPCTV